MPGFWIRLRCAVLGHRWVQEDRGAPVIHFFFLCSRCGKWERAL